MVSVAVGALDIVDTAKHYWREDREVYYAMRDTWASQLCSFMGVDRGLDIVRSYALSKGMLWTDVTEQAYQRLSPIQLMRGVLLFLVSQKEDIPLT
jgi:hypothetical protein